MTRHFPDHRVVEAMQHRGPLLESVGATDLLVMLAAGHPALSWQRLLFLTLLASLTPEQFTDLPESRWTFR